MTSRDITNPEWAGGDVYHFEVAKRLVNHGNRVTMLCSRYKGCKNQEEIQGIQIVRIRGGALRIISNFFAYQKRLKGKQDVIVEEAEGPAGPLLAFLYTKEPVVIMWHQLGKTIYFNQFPYPVALSLFVMEKLYLALAHACQIVVPSHERAREFADVGFPMKRINVVPAAFVRKEVIRRKDRTEEKKPYFLILGKIRRYKAYHHAVQALRLLRDCSEKCSLVIAGRQGEERYYTELKKLVKNHGLQDSVSIKLNVSENKKATLLSNALALIVTSPIEGFSIVSVEANALGIPVIASEGVPDEVVTDGFNGIKYKFGDTEALARAMSKLLRDGALRERMSANAVDSAAKFSWDKTSKLFKEVLQKTLDSKRITYR